MSKANLTNVKYELDINGYLADGSRILGSGYIARTNLTFTYAKRTYTMSLGRNTFTGEWQLGWIGQ